MTLEEHDAVSVVGPVAPCDVMLVCEHASRYFPPVFGDLGLPEEVKASHVAWDPGALDLTRALADRFEATYIAGGVSRLLYDCNRPPDAQSAIPVRSEVFDIAENANLTKEQRQSRVDLIYKPFREAVEQARALIQPKALVTVHSFTPVYHGQRRDVEIGILHDHDTRLADGMLEALQTSSYVAERNVPYGPEDGVTHSLRLYALPDKVPNVMIEVRNDLLERIADVVRVADVLERALRHAIKGLDGPSRREGR